MTPLPENAVALPHNTAAAKDMTFCFATLKCMVIGRGFMEMKDESHSLPSSGESFAGMCSML